MIRPVMTAALIGLLVAACGSDSDDLEQLIREADPSVDDGTVECIIDELEARGLSADDVSDAAEGRDTMPRGAQAAFDACVSATVTEATAPEQPIDAYGSDATLDGLWDACDAGDAAACDELYLRSPIGSEYEDFGETCGGRSESVTELCEDQFAEPTDS